MLGGFLLLGANSPFATSFQKTLAFSGRAGRGAS